ncbi:F-box domain-containing protein [Colletotrichum orchidophilum]|uniref:F-box domain-containing protein n=1 Tax=Colletotrichum orchidophilum TaxID=1209926 RepID=A0A1G4BJY3_9PEZI|nr:F-box domain-containing protein [Colletotrichum orchidophilum]OHF01623.1 F-box domain-containing protein [Colletotrichum orchidophilum]
MSSLSSSQVPAGGSTGAFPLHKLPRDLVVEVVRQLDKMKCDPTNQDDDISLVPLSMTCRLLRDVSVPFVFRVAQLTTAEHLLADHIESVEMKDEICRSIHVLSIYTEGPSASRTPATFSQIQGIRLPCEKSAARDLAFFIDSLPNLQELRLDFRFKAVMSLIKPLRRTLELHEMDFTSITALSFPVATDLTFIATMFPNLRALSIEAPVNRTLNQIAGLRHVSRSFGAQLVYVQLCKMRWERSDFRDIQRMFPHVTHLTIGGSMAFGGPPGRPTWDLRAATKDIQSLRKLQVLAISDERSVTSLSPISPVHHRASIIASKLKPVIGFHNDRSRRTDQAWGIIQNLPNLKVVYIVNRSFSGDCFVPIKDNHGVVIDLKTSEAFEEQVWPVA